MPARKIMFLFKIGRLSNALKRLFSFSSSIHCYNTRQCNSFYIPPWRTNIRQFAFCFQGTKVFNSLNIENFGRLSLSKSKLRTLLLNWLPSSLFFLLFSSCVSVCLFGFLLMLLSFCESGFFPFSLKYFHLNDAI